MAATLENISQLERRLNITLPAAEIDHEVQSRLKRLVRDAITRSSGCLTRVATCAIKVQLACF